MARPLTQCAGFTGQMLSRAALRAVQEHHARLALVRNHRLLHRARPLGPGMASPASARLRRSAWG